MVPPSASYLLPCLSPSLPPRLQASASYWSILHVAARVISWPKPDPFPLLLRALQGSSAPQDRAQALSLVFEECITWPLFTTLEQKPHLSPRPTGDTILPPGSPSQHSSPQLLPQTAAVLHSTGVFPGDCDSSGLSSQTQNKPSSE